VTSLMVITFLIGAPAAVIGAMALAAGHQAVGSVGCLIAAAAYGLRGLVRIWEGDMAMAAWDACLTGTFAYIAWRNRPRRNRFAEKALGVVRNLGHRLVVVPAGGRS
jgi:hypothetical protein